MSKADSPDRPTLPIIQPAACLSLITQEVGGGTDVARVFDARGRMACRLCDRCTAREFLPGLWHCLLFSPIPLRGDQAARFGISG